MESQTILKKTRTRKAKVIDRSVPVPFKKEQPPIGLSVQERYEYFVVKGEKKDDCWSWSGYLKQRSYKRVDGTRVRIQGDPYIKTKKGGKTKLINVSRLAWEIHRGPIYDKTLSVAHRCDNKLCTNPEHLALCSHSYNMFDKALRGRCSPGKTTFLQRIEIAQKIRQGNKNPNQLAKEYGIGRECIAYQASSRAMKALFGPVPEKKPKNDTK